MVKPSKSMQPEQVDEVALRAGRNKKNSMRDGSNSFHNYMARKIAVQRQQFGLVLPPPPPPKVEPRSETQIPQQFVPKPPPGSPGKSSLLKRNVSESQQQPSGSSPTPKKHRAITFELGTKPPAQGTNGGGKRKVSATTSSSKARSMLLRLGKRHGHVQQKKERIQQLQRKSLESRGDGLEQKARHEHRKEMEMEMDGATMDSSFASVDSSGFRRTYETPRELPLARTINDAPSTSDPLMSLNGSTVKDHDTLLTTRNVVPSTHAQPLTTFTDVSQQIETSTLELTSPSVRRNFRPDLFFYGIVIKVQGFTDPDEHTLRRMVQKHGGDYETYETTRVTHIIASAMSTAKQNIYKNQRRPTPVCVPAWIVDSVKTGVLLPHGKYLLNKEQNQQGLKSMFHGNGQPLPVENSVPKPTSRRQVIPEIVKPHTNSPSRRSEIDVSMVESPSTNGQVKTIVESASNTKDPATPIIGSKESRGKTNTQFINGKIRTVGTDPSFVESYFKSSRLSFIGSYKQRVTNKRKEFHDNDVPLIPADAKRFIFHVDMDQFFAAVVLRNYPEFRNRPVAISHLGMDKGQHVPNESHVSFKNSTSECATVNYEARKYGIKKGMFLKAAYERCPDLIVLKYDFEGYDEVAQQVLEILEAFCADPNHPGAVEPISCDEYIMEVFVDASGQDVHEHVIALAEELRAEIYEKTLCTATAGIGTNKYLAKLACDKAKPNGSFVVKDHTSLLSGKLLRDMPGVGWRSEPKLKEKGLIRVDDVWDLGLEGKRLLCEIMGAKNGERMYDFCYGRDERDVLPNAERKTVGAECNYGVRFDGPYGIDHFMMELAKEVEKRMSCIGVKGCKVTLKLKKKKQDAKEAPKFLGHGRCHNLSKSGNLKQASRDAAVIASLGMKLFQQFGIRDIHDVRGMGIVMSNLRDDAKDTKTTNSGLQQWLTNAASTKSPDLSSHRIREEESSLVHDLSEDAIIPRYDEDSITIPTREMAGFVRNRNDRGSSFYKSQYETNPQDPVSINPKDALSKLSSTAVTVHNSMLMNEKRLVAPFHRVNTYIEDLLPLKEYLQKHEAITEGNVLSTCLVFFIVVHVERPQAVRPMIRMMVQQQWQSNAKTIVSILDKINVFLKGTKLDKTWLLGKG
ncbi:nucleotidyltransferase/DNA polymerase [Nitzschia inconspicua]|uniref:DNA repair protein REV1 n=1 Tax=Nitzschia inconspicua TaxID=303405 RepID=A0A9K3PMV8_9STRA|nr:nucleotidyltransferase/DNA polymerase [Nitzschia inconspicua]